MPRMFRKSSGFFPFLGSRTASIPILLPSTVKIAGGRLRSFMRVRLYFMPESRSSNSIEFLKMW